ncbi:SDR family NAD(P)-dependent oxidoreductase [Gordonia terrae]|uniref:3-oxoacyl-[acyl-carrier-protein] reductase MabA n=2 Tax=Gordonia terrae TaxID=2055 RepID=A0AAD0NW99_9ACTN|nr:SDR family oxidoreductase [Gordonia terrae]VTR09641.1 3-oxoacyl-(acyl-carrier-protein) reductase [Clostridioides difficile]ANY22248.1 short-chain dehydrogenase [Gordonia terrae]AWO82987.1 KR domain-containing protein [Gordonia terrae]VTS30531.1 3-oxoacyl-[acyl-carrier-protein] reductase FabG [Gordonia terrae]GAB46279.1 putative 3-oxoacyl-[acyl-carrier-protein] reductase [Gordonia terrae NBRC 100016]
MTLDGRVALVTGAGQNAGLGIAQSLAAAGAAIIVNDLAADRAESAAAAIGEAGGRAVAAPFDVTDYDAVQAGIRAAEGRLGPVDILVNNAGIPTNGSRQPFATSSPDSWPPYIDINLYGSLNTTHCVLSGMIERRFGRVIQISSGSGATAHRGLGAVTYGAGKAGIEGAMRHVASEVGEHGITVNTLALGLMDNLQAALDAGYEPLPSIYENNFIRRLGRGSDIGAAAVWLASTDAEFVTAQTIHINGGAYSGR